MTVWVDEIRDYGDSVKGAARRWGSKWSHLTGGGDCDEPAGGPTLWEQTDA